MACKHLGVNPLPIANFREISAELNPSLIGCGRHDSSSHRSETS
jgi:hypothetical protein